MLCGINGNRKFVVLISASSILVGTGDVERDHVHSTPQADDHRSVGFN